MAAHQPHRLPCGGAHRRNAEPFCQPPDGAVRGFTRLNHPRRHPQRPRRRIDQERAGFGLVVDEVALAELVLDELVGGAGVGHAQQGFREHHQRQALLGRERELAQHVLDAAEPVVIGANGLDQARRGAVDPLFLRGARSRRFRAAAPPWRHRPARRAHRMAEGRDGSDSWQASQVLRILSCSRSWQRETAAIAFAQIFLRKAWRTDGIDAQAETRSGGLGKTCGVLRSGAVFRGVAPDCRRRRRRQRLN